MKEAIKKIIDAGVRAPSGDNCQPWKFVVRGDEIYLYNMPERDTSMYSWGQRSSFLSHGAVLENMLIKAAVLGYDLDVEVCEDEADDLVAKIRLEKIESKEHPMHEHIHLRATNRKVYSGEALTSHQREQILKTAEELDYGKVLLIEEEGDKKILARAGASNEEILFKNKKLHEFFFNHVIWDDEEEADKVGFHIDTFELADKEKKAFRLFSKWNVLKFLTFIGVHKAVAKTNAKLHESASAIGVVTVAGDSKQDFVRAGRLVQKVWLKVTSLGLSMQPVTGMTFLHLKVENNELEDFSSAQVKLIKNCFNKIKDVFGIKDETIAMMFKIGHGGEPSKRTHRLPVQVEFQD